MGIISTMHLSFAWAQKLTYAEAQNLWLSITDRDIFKSHRKSSIEYCLTVNDYTKMVAITSEKECLYQNLPSRLKSEHLCDVFRLPGLEQYKKAAGRIPGHLVTNYCKWFTNEKKKKTCNYKLQIMFLVLLIRDCYRKAYASFISVNDQVPQLMPAFQKGITFPDWAALRQPIWHLPYNLFFSSSVLFN